MKIYLFSNFKLETEKGLNAEQIANFEKIYGKLLGVFISGVGYVPCRYDSHQISVSKEKVNENAM